MKKAARGLVSHESGIYKDYALTISCRLFIGYSAKLPLTYLTGGSGKIVLKNCKNVARSKAFACSQNTDRATFSALKRMEELCRK